MKKYFALALCLFWAQALWADSQPTPPVIPVPGGDNALPPPPDQLTPATVPALPGSGNTVPRTAQPQDNTIPPPPVAATPPPAAAVPTDTPVLREAAPTPGQAAPPPAEEPASSQVSAGALSDYFPITQGDQWAYEYLKPGPGETAKGTFTVQCESAKAMANGTVRAVFETTEGGQPIRNHYSLYGDKVEHTATGDETFTGDYVFKLPATPSGAAYWAVTEANGTAHKSKAVFSTAEVYHKTYPDCVVVTEKVIQGGKTSNTVIYYYAKGIGLVSMEVYSPSMRLIQPKSFALVSGPNSNH